MRLTQRAPPRCSGILKVSLGSRLTGLLIAALGLASQPATPSEPWEAPLAGGGQVTVDPRTHQPLLMRDGHQSQLWDGVHRLQDGTVILVREGRVVPRQDMTNPPRLTEEADNTLTSADPPRTGPLAGTAPCEQLIEKVCGQVIECWGRPACAAARQLRAMDHEELLGSAHPAEGTQTGTQCHEALSNDYFSACTSPPTLP